MTTRLTRWLTTLDNFEAKMAQLPAVRRYGRLTRATGLVLEATGLQLPLGATCVIERQNGTETHEVEKAKSLALTVNGCFNAAGGSRRCPARRAGLCQKHFG